MVFEAIGFVLIVFAPLFIVWSFFQPVSKVWLRNIEGAGLFILGVFLVMRVDGIGHEFFDRFLTHPKVIQEHPVEDLQYFSRRIQLATQGLSAQERLKLNEELVRAVESGQSEETKKLVVLGADVNAWTHLGTTVLMEAAAYGYGDVVKVLLFFGADSGAVSKNGITALEIARRNQRGEAVSLLEKDPGEFETFVDGLKPRDIGTMDFTEVRIQGMKEFDFLTREEILGQRRIAVQAYPEFFFPEYRPDTLVFGPMKSGKPWWGMLGISYYGPGGQSLEGLSEESRFILNPYLLLGLSEIYAYQVDQEFFRPAEIYPKLRRLVWGHDRRWAQATYDVSDFFAGEEKYRYPPKDRRKVVLSVLNARDYGFRHFAFVGEESENVQQLQGSGEVHRLQAEIHRDSSCGFPGGCNNAGPVRKSYILEVGDLPARACFKLWQWKPKNEEAPADMVYLIEMV